MADPVIPVAAPIAVAPAPIVEAATAPVQAAPAPVVEAAAPIAPAVVAPAPVAPVEPAKAATVLGEAMAKPPEPAPVAEAPKPAEGAKPESETKAPEGQSVEPAPPPSYEPFALPEGFSVDAERLNQFTGLLGEFESLTKADHAEVQKFGQQLVSRHIEELQAAVDRVITYYLELGDRQKNDWKDQFLADPEIGGNHFQTTVDSALNFIRTHGGTDEQKAEFQTLMETSGLGNHPAMIRILAKAGMAMSEGKPLAAKAPAPGPKSKIEAMYGKSRS